MLRNSYASCATSTTPPVADEEGNWAVRAGYATQAEDGDIDLTHEGRKALDSGQT